MGQDWNRTMIRKVFLALLVVVATAATNDPTTTTTTSLLRWAPPTLVNPVTIKLPANGNITERLDNQKDYIIQYPSVRRVGGLTLKGGRNIVIIGGASTMPSGSNGARNLQISDRTGTVVDRIVHVEGLDIDGSGGGQGDGIGIAAPNTIVQLENDRVTGLIGHFSSVHADVVQTWGGVRALRVYDFTGASHYNNLYLRRENSPLGPPNLSVKLDHVNMFGYVNPKGWDEPATLRAIAIGTQPADTDCDGHGHCGPANAMSKTNCEMAGTVTLNHFYSQPPATTVQRFMWPTDYMTTAGCPSVRDSSGAYWPALTGSVTGTITPGAPQGGDFVPSGFVGVGYQSPGYQ